MDETINIEGSLRTDGASWSIYFVCYFMLLILLDDFVYSFI